MSTTITLHGIARGLDDADGLARALDELLARGPALFALGEPTHGIAAFPLLRNEILAHLVERGFRSIVLEMDVFAARIVDDYVSGGAGDLDTVLAAGFSHGFGNVPGNRELVAWLRAYNAVHEPADRVRFYGMEAPVEYAGAPSPRHAMTEVTAYLPAPLRPESGSDLDALLGEESEWSNAAAMYDAAASLGNSARARALRVIADDLASALRRAAPFLRPADPIGYDHALAQARTALGLLRYHAAMATPGPDRMANLLGVRAEMMADNLFAVLAHERSRGPSLVFAHNVHLLRTQSTMPIADDAVNWCAAGAFAALELGDRYLFVATDASPSSDPETLQRLLAEATGRRALFPAPALCAALPASAGTSTPMLPGHIPLRPRDLPGADAVLFLADTDGKRHPYW
ncbi:erythromycin esterase family protein [Nocardia sp. 2]|uniref:Erythromycin esterase family protein n=1 Tax=Nocardia acididurans TaxID=2802282 RepID=A0ABS1M361_9NOCA|nr:erythromycin esterase family protein [Nocardia acididurans]MBL1074259.1 erythromycin esterase family protein [Nocardia acididurans]